MAAYFSNHLNKLLIENKYLILISTAIFSLLVWLIYIAGLWFQFNFHPLVTAGETNCVVLKPGDSANIFVNQLISKTNYKHRRFLLWYLGVSDKSRNLQAGEYCFGAEKSASILVDDLVAGRNTIHTFTIVDGWSFKEVMRALNQLPYIDHKLTGYSAQTVAKALQMPHSSPEGLLYPDSYFITYGTSDIEILQQAYALLKTKVAQEWHQRASHLPYRTEYQALIAASIIEKESAIASDRRLISSVIINRLHKRMYLQMDPTVIYGLGGEPVRLTHHAMRKDTPYNSYLHIGLPPTPICMPSIDAINAALHPAQTQYYYFVAKGDGYHQFSKTLKEQRSAIKQYLK